jgi:Ni/Co efflux regulator RcnB
MRLFVKSLLAGALAVSAVAPAFADPPRWSNSRHNDRDWRDDRGRDRDWDDRRRGDRDWRDDRRDDRRWRESRHHWRKGDRFDHHRTRYVVVRDYDRYHLRAPRRGEYYARTDTGDILLIAAATGLVIWALNQ